MQVCVSGWKWEGAVVDSYGCEWVWVCVCTCTHVFVYVFVGVGVVQV